MADKKEVLERLQEHLRMILREASALKVVACRTDRPYAVAIEDRVKSAYDLSELLEGGDEGP